jgi:hypothetical protein
MLENAFLQHIVLAHDDGPYALAVRGNPQEGPWMILRLVARHRGYRHGPLVFRGYCAREARSRQDGQHAEGQEREKRGQKSHEEPAFLYTQLIRGVSHKWVTKEGDLSFGGSVITANEHEWVRTKSMRPFPFAPIFGHSRFLLILFVGWEIGEFTEENADFSKPGLRVLEE